MFIMSWYAVLCYETDISDINACLQMLWIVPNSLTQTECLLQDCFCLQIVYCLVRNKYIDMLYFTVIS